MGRKDAFAKTVKANFLCEAEIKIGGELMVERATEVDRLPRDSGGKCCSTPHVAVSHKAD